MQLPLIASWTEHDAALDALFERMEKDVAIFDYDLRRLSLDRPKRHEQLRTFLRRDPKSRLRIVVQAPDRALSAHPRLRSLLDNFGHNLTLAQPPEHLAHLADSLLLVDGRHALIRFHRDHVRSKHIVDNPVETGVYARRFEEIWNEGVTPLSPSPLGL